MTPKKFDALAKRYFGEVLEPKGFSCSGSEAATFYRHVSPDIVHFVLVALLSSWLFAAFGMVIGTVVPPQQISLIFTALLSPMIFFGCAYYPWRGLDAVPVMKYLVLVNPMVYVAEGMRGALTPNVPHMALPVVGIALLVIAAVFWTLGMRSFIKRAIG